MLVNIQFLSITCTRAFNKFCVLDYMSVSEKGIAWLIVPFNYAND